MKYLKPYSIFMIGLLIYSLAAICADSFMIPQKTFETTMNLTPIKRIKIETQFNNKHSVIGKIQIRNQDLWIINQSLIINWTFSINESIVIVNSDISVSEEGELIIRDSILYFNLSSKNNPSISVKGKIFIINSTLDIYTNGCFYSIRAESGSTILIDSSNISHGGYYYIGYIGAIDIYTDNASIRNSNFYECYCGISLNRISSSDISSNTISDNFVGIFLDRVEMSDIYNNNIVLNYYGIHGAYSYKNNISKNIFTNNRYGILLEDSYRNNISENRFYECSRGIMLSFCKYNFLSQNDINKSDIGIKIHYSYNNTVISNNITHGKIGVLINGYQNNITNNVINYNEKIGIKLGDKNIVTMCQINHNGIAGIIVEDDNNNISMNSICFNDFLGILIFGDNNIIYLNNFIRNYQNAIDEGKNNIWNTPTKVQYVFNNKTFENFLGNYWDDHDVTDKNNDGIIDSAYSNIDKYPLTDKYESYKVISISTIKYTPPRHINYEEIVTVLSIYLIILIILIVAIYYSKKIYE